MKTLSNNRSRFLARSWLAVAVLGWAGSAQAQSDETPEPAPEPAAQAPSEPQSPQPAQPVPHAEARPLPQQLPPMPDGHPPFMDWRRVEVTPPERENRSLFTWNELPLSIGVEGRTTWPQQSGTRRLVGHKSATASGFSVSYDVLKLMEKLTARVDLGWTSGRDTNVSSWSSDEEELRTRLATMGLSLRFHLFQWLAPYARVAGGFGWDKLTVGGSAGTWRDKQSFAHGSAGGGLCLRTPSLSFWPQYPWLGLGLTLNIEGGYFVAPDARFSLKASSPNIDKPIPSNAVSIGTMGRSAPYLRITFGLAF